MLQPKRVRRRKVQKGKGNMKGNSYRGHRLSNGTFGIKALEQDLITSRQIEAARIAEQDICKEKGNFGLKYLQISQLLKNH